MTALQLQIGLIVCLWILVLLCFLPLIARPQRANPAGAAVAATPRQLRLEAPAGYGAPGRSERLILSSPEISVGRSEGSTLRLDDQFASNQHAVLRYSPGSLVLDDLGSTNGTMLNDRPVTEPVSLKVGDVIRIGQTRLYVE